LIAVEIYNIFLRARFGMVTFVSSIFSENAKLKLEDFMINSHKIFLYEVYYYAIYDNGCCFYCKL